MSAESLAAAWLSEMWPTCREESREEREVKRALDAAYAPAVESDVHKYTGSGPAERGQECA